MHHLAGAADSLNARIARAGTDIDRAFNAVNGQRQPIEGFSGMPSVDQRKALEYAVEDAKKAAADLNKLISAEIPAAYKAAKKEWTKKVGVVATPGSAKK